MPTRKLDMVKVAAARVLPTSVDTEELVLARTRRDILWNAQRTMLPIEDDSSHEVSTTLRKVSGELRQLERRQKIVEFSDGVYQLLDLHPLRWRDTEGFPIYAVFSLDAPQMGFRSTAKFTVGNRIAATSEMIPAMPYNIQLCYGDVIRNMLERSRKMLQKEKRAQEVKTTLFTRFGGLIPLEVKEEITRARASKLFHSILLVAEVEEWHIDSIVVSRQGDPLIIGFDGYETWLIAAFDTTSAEQLIADEFAVRADI